MEEDCQGRSLKIVFCLAHTNDMGGNLIAWIKKEFVLLVVTNNKNMNRRWLIAQIKDPGSIQISFDWHKGEQQEQNGARKKQLIRKMQINYYSEVGQGLQTPLCVFTGSLSGRRENTGWFCRLGCLLFFLKCVKMNFSPTSLFSVKISPGCVS